jgi:GxxExxY protein
MTEHELSRIVIGCAIEVHRTLGPGLLESIYERTLLHEMRAKGLFVQQQVPVDVQYKGHTLGAAFRADLLVERKLLVEVKAVEVILPVHDAQTLSYIKLLGYLLGLRINFDVPVLTQGIRRFINSPL